MLNPEFDESLFCRIYINNSDKWIDGILTYVNVEKKTAEVFFSAKYFQNLITEGNKIIIKSINNNNDKYIFTGHISNKVISIRRQAATISINEVIKFNDSRNFERFKVTYPVTVKKLDNAETSSGILVDISSRGLLITSPIDFDPDTSLNFEIFFTHEKSVSFIGKILRKLSSKNGYNYGIVIEEIDKTNNLKLNKLLSSLDAEQKHLFHEWSIFNKLRYTLYAVMALAGVAFIAVVLSIIFMNN